MFFTRTRFVRHSDPIQRKSKQRNGGETRAKTKSTPEHGKPRLGRNICERNVMVVDSSAVSPKAPDCYGLHQRQLPPASGHSPRARTRLDRERDVPQEGRRTDSTRHSGRCRPRPRRRCARETWSNHRQVRMAVICRAAAHRPRNCRGSPAIRPAACRSGSPSLHRRQW